MIVVALAVLALAGLVALGRKPLMVRQPARMAALGLAAVAAAAAAYDAARGGWIGGSILGTAALWLATSSRRPPAGEQMMSAERAASLLGVQAGASRDEIESAYRRLIQRVHPDVGGAAGLAAELTEARATLLGRR